MCSFATEKPAEDPTGNQEYADNTIDQPLGTGKFTEQWRGESQAANADQADCRWHQEGKRI